MKEIITIYDTEKIYVLNHHLQNTYKRKYIQWMKFEMKLDNPMSKCNI